MRLIRRQGGLARASEPLVDVKCPEEKGATPVWKLTEIREMERANFEGARGE